MFVQVIYFGVKTDSAQNNHDLHIIALSQTNSTVVLSEGVVVMFFLLLLFCGGSSSSSKSLDRLEPKLWFHGFNFHVTTSGQNTFPY